MVLTSTHNLCFGAKIRKIGVNPSFTIQKCDIRGIHFTDMFSFFSGLETAMLILPSVQQWSFSYSVLYSHSNSASLRATFVFPNEAAATALTMKMGESSFPTSASPVVDVLGM